MYNPYALEERKQNLHVSRKQEVEFGLSDSTRITHPFLTRRNTIKSRIKATKARIFRPDQSYQIKNFRIDYEYTVQL